MMGRGTRGMLLVLAGVSCSLSLSETQGAGDAPRADSLRDRAELSLPLLDRKRVVAHYMTNMLFYRGGAYAPTYFGSEHYRQDGPSKAIGGFTQTIPLMDFRQEMSIDEAAEFELRAATTLGLDGFQFFYPLAPDANGYERYNQVIQAFFRAAERTGIDFKFTVCFCSPGGPRTERQKIETWGGAVEELIRSTAGLDHWLKTPDGRHIFFLWNCHGISDKVQGVGRLYRDPDLFKYDALAYERLSERCGVKAAFVYHVTSESLKRKEFIEEALSFFPAFWGFLPVMSLDEKLWGEFADKCRKRGRAYTASVYPDFYTSKLYAKQRRAGTTKFLDRIWKLGDALELGVEGMWRRVLVSDLSGEFRRNFEHGIKYDSPMINVTTWNDYPEGHQVCPDINHNFAFSILLRYYKNIWTGRPESNDREIGLLFFKKYAASTRPSIADFDIRSIRDIPLSKEDFIEAVTILKSPATVSINGKDRGVVKAGLGVTRIPIEAGPVRLEVVRDGKTIIDLEAPEWITNEPYRTDRFTVGYSNEYLKNWREIFGEREPRLAAEYAQDETGISNWRRGVQLVGFDSNQSGFRCNRLD